MTESTAPSAIVCFSKDWFEDRTSNHHVMLELAKTHRVLWLNSISTRTPDLASGRDLRKIVRKLHSFSHGPEQVAGNLWVFTPLVLPLPHSDIATAVNKWVLRATVHRLRSMLGLREFQLWSFLPSAADYFGTLGESISVYYCTDEWSMFGYVDTKMADLDRAICEKADVVFGVNQALVDNRLPVNRETHLAPHGVDHPLFATALADQTAVPADIGELPKPILGFYGTLQDWVDYDLLTSLAERRRDWNIVLIGEAHVDLGRLASQPNVHLLGRKPHAQLPAYCKAFDVALIPYRLVERMKYVNPIKLREYLCAGVPVVSTAVPEVLRYTDYCTIADSPESFEKAIADILHRDNPARRRMRSEAMKAETWDRRVADLAEVVEAVARRKHG